MAVGVGVEVGVSVGVDVGVGVAVAVGVGVNVEVGVAATMLRTLIALFALEPAKEPPPPKAPINVIRPAPFGVTWQLALPWLSVGALQSTPFREKPTVCPVSGLGGCTVTSVRLATTVSG